MEVLNNMSFAQFLVPVVLFLAIVLLPTSSALFLLAHYRNWGNAETFALVIAGLLVDLLTRYSHLGWSDLRKTIERIRPPRKPDETGEKRTDITDQEQTDHPPTPALSADDN